MKKYIKELCLIEKVFEEKSLVNGNLKPSNIILDENNDIFITDICQNRLYPNILTVDINSLYYYSPEQLQSKECDITSDLWSLGMILYFIYEFPHKPLLNYKKLLKTDNIINIKCKEYMSRKGYYIISHLLCINKNERMKLSDILDILKPLEDRECIIL